MTVSVVVPVWNDAEGALRLVDQLDGIDFVSEIILVDDFSQTHLSDCIDPQDFSTRLKIFRQSSNLGAGAARNAGLELVTNPLCIFIDSDDEITEDFSLILDDCINNIDAFDFVIFRHIDSREMARGRDSALHVDEVHWNKLTTQGLELGIMSPSEQEDMASISAYPWNKVYRTKFLIDHQISCTEIPVHNDIEIHWASFLLAERVLYTNRRGILHYVEETGSRITNRKGRERLRVFEALDNVSSRIKSDRPRIGMRIAFWWFYTKLMDWIPDNLEDEFQEEFGEMRLNHVLLNVSRTEYRLLAHRDPALSTKILSLLKKSPQ